MKITVAGTAGFCFGVNRAVIEAERELGENARLCSLGELIHNRHVVNRLTARGMRIIDSPDMALPDETVLIRSHGVGKAAMELLKQKSIRFIDATCPFVKNIHKIVDKYHKIGYNIIIIGDKYHPEVRAIAGWCGGGAFVAGSPEDLRGLDSHDKPVCVVAQTTITRNLWEKCVEILKTTCNRVSFFDTICSTTKERQDEAVRLAEKVDAMLVIGGRHSSNTKRLAELCREVCQSTFHIEDAHELPVLYPFAAVGITAGASTPACIIKEVVAKMEEKDVTQTTDTGEMSFAEAFEESLVTLHTGDVVKGTIIGITPTEVYVNLGFKADGVIPITELTDDPLLKPDDIVKMGDEIDVFVARVNDMEGTVLLSKKKLDSIHGWQAIEDAFENKTILSGRIIEVIKGGVIVLCEGTKVFVPASQANDRYLNDLSVLENKQVSLRIIDINKRRRKIVGSIKSVLVEERARKMKEFWESVEKGKEYVGVVKTITPFGAFVDLGGVDGLIHISELSWNRIGHPSEVIKEGDEASVYIIEADREKNKVSLGYKRAEDNPWIKAKEQLHENDIVKCKVVRLVHFGAFVEILPDIDGLVHVSQIANHHIAKPSDELSVGQEVTAKIIEIDWENHKIGLSIRELLPDEPVQKPSNSEDAEPTSHVEEMKSTMGEVMEAIQLDNTVEEPAADE